MGETKFHGVSFFWRNKKDPSVFYFDNEKIMEVQKPTGRAHTTEYGLISAALKNPLWLLLKGSYNRLDTFAFSPLPNQENIGYVQPRSDILTPEEAAEVFIKLLAEMRLEPDLSR